MTKQKKSSKPTPQPDPEVKDMKPQSDPKGGGQNVQTDHVQEDHRQWYSFGHLPDFITG